MAIKEVWIECDCDSCVWCVDICPEVFIMREIASVIEGVDFAPYEQKIKDAVEFCQPDAIRFSE